LLACLKCVENLLTSIQQGKEANKPNEQEQQQYAQAEAKLLMNKAVCEFTMSSIKSEQHFKSELDKLFKLVNFI
jgi:hypothetical protein